MELYVQFVDLAKTNVFFVMMVVLMAELHTDKDRFSW